MGQALSLAVCVGLPVANSTVSVILNRRKNDKWYSDLKKPKWTPPRWLFGFMDIAFNASMGTASWFIWKQGWKDQKTPLIVYGAQLLLNLFYNQMFYHCHEMGCALADILLIDCLATCATVLFFKESQTGGSLLVPYVAYAYFCTALTARTLTLNDDSNDGETAAAEPKTTATTASGSAPAGAKVEVPKVDIPKVEAPKAPVPKTGAAGSEPKK